MLEMTLQGMNLGNSCLEALTTLSPDAQMVLLRALLSRLRDGVGEQVGLCLSHGAFMHLLLLRQARCTSCSSQSDLQRCSLSLHTASHLVHKRTVNKGRDS